ncbi:hypothetical protein SAMN05444411_105166 [Lutibacter oricola]|uniref:Lipoprotein n=1 Tax=Lutibacter oricola TaxID=762486 RepID=A0A1H3BML7_9FLAO|nr:hypothetical protein [Lutibacter oricola]SDX43153.1 hypothetical protein SAMN05444411_105166 [Lutibacter oricola]
MKTLIKISSLVFLIIITITSCSSVKLIDSWENSKLNEINKKSIAVISKTNNDFARIQFETDISKKLNENNLKSIESYKILRKLDTSNNLSFISTKNVQNKLKKQGIDIIIATILKDTQEYTRTAVENNISVHHTVRYSRRYRKFFVIPYYNVEPSSSYTYTSKRYILETVVYDITKDEDNQLIAILTSEVDNPKSLGKISKDFSKKITEQILK